MGVQLGEIIEKKKIELEAMQDRIIAIDAFNSLYQFLSIIRQPDGTPLMNNAGKVTSHLSGLFYRTNKLIEEKIKPVYVFDGKPPELKHKTIAQRLAIKEKATEKYAAAKERGETSEMRKHAQAMSKLTAEMVNESKTLLEAMGVPWAQAPSEGEAQAAYMTKKGDAWAAASQDYDSLLFESPNLIRNMTITGKRKLPGKSVYVQVEPELIELQPSLDTLGINQNQLVDIGILIGTDYNNGIKGIGPKKALALVKEGKTLEEIYTANSVEPEVDLKELQKMFLKPDVTDKYELKWSPPNKELLTELLVKKNNFSEERVVKVFEHLKEKSEEEGSQSRLNKWFK